MSDYISREETLKAIQPRYAPAINKVLAGIIESVPAADVKPVVCGQKIVKNRPMSAAYIYIQEGYDGSLNVNWYGDGKRVLVHGAIENNPVEYCSVCGARLDDIYQNFCPNCGAEMDGVVL